MQRHKRSIEICFKQTFIVYSTHTHTTTFTPAILGIGKLPTSILHTVQVVAAALAAVRRTVWSHMSFETEACFHLRNLLECQGRRTCSPLVVPVRSSTQVVVHPKPGPQAAIQIRKFVVVLVLVAEPERSRSLSRQLARQLGLVRRESLLRVERTEDQQVAENTEEPQAVGHTEEPQAVGHTEEQEAAGRTEEHLGFGRTEGQQAVGRTEEPEAVGHTAELQAAWNSSSKGSRFEQEARNKNLRP
jgi:hypothetical protein